VLTVVDAAGDRRINAYVVLTPQAGPNAAVALRDHAASSLPAYMVPA
jgi:hypothetical protein